MGSRVRARDLQVGETIFVTSTHGALSVGNIAHGKIAKIDRTGDGFLLFTLENGITYEPYGDLDLIQKTL